MLSDADITFPNCPTTVPSGKTDDEIISECEQLILDSQNESADLRANYKKALDRLKQRISSKSDSSADPLSLQANKIIEACEQTYTKIIMADCFEYRYLIEILARTQIGLIKPEDNKNLNKLTAVVNKIDGNRSRNEIIAGAVLIFAGLALMAVTYALVVGTFGIAPLIGFSSMAIIGKVIGYSVGGLYVGRGLIAMADGNSNKREYGLIQSCSLFKTHAQTKVQVENGASRNAKP